MTTDTGQIQLTRRFKCPQDRLWSLLTDPGAREIWASPSDDDTLVIDESDVREDGMDLHRCGPKEAPDYTILTRWYRLAGPDSACFSETVDAGGARIATSHCTYALVQDGDHTDLTVSVTTTSFVGAEALADFTTGWNSGLARLERLVDGTLQ